MTTSGTVTVQQDFLVRSGDEETLSVYLRHGLNQCGTVRVQNLDTSNYLTSAGAWQAAAADVFTAASATFTLHSLAFDVESATDIGANDTTLRVQFNVADGALFTCHFDTFAITATTTLSIPRPVALFPGNVRLIDTSLSPDLETDLTMLTDDEWHVHLKGYPTAKRFPGMFPKLGKKLPEWRERFLPEALARAAEWEKQ